MSVRWQNRYPTPEEVAAHGDRHRSLGARRVEGNWLVRDGHPALRTLWLVQAWVEKSAIWVRVRGTMGVSDVFELQRGIFGDAWAPIDNDCEGVPWPLAAEEAPRCEGCQRLTELATALQRDLSTMLGHATQQALDAASARARLDEFVKLQTSLTDSDRAFVAGREEGMRARLHTSELPMEEPDATPAPPEHLPEMSANSWRRGWRRGWCEADAHVERNHWKAEAARMRGAR